MVSRSIVHYPSLDPIVGEMAIYRQLNLLNELQVVVSGTQESNKVQKSQRLVSGNGGAQFVNGVRLWKVSHKLGTDATYYFDVVVRWFRGEVRIDTNLRTSEATSHRDEVIDNDS